MTHRRLAASLATAALVLGGAVVAVPAVAASDGPPSDGTPIFDLSATDEVHVQPGDTFSLFVSISREGDLEPEPDADAQIAVKITFPEQLEFEGGSCDAFVFDDDLVQSTPYEAGEDPDHTFTSGNECVLDGGLGTSAYVSAVLDFSFRDTAFFTDDPALDVLPPPGVIGFEIERTVVVDDSSMASGTDVEGPRATAATAVVFDVPYQASVTPASHVTWPGEDVIEVDFTLRAPRVDTTVGFAAASTSWDLRWPAFATLIADDAATDGELCDPLSLTDRLCHVTFTQRPPTPPVVDDVPAVLKAAAVVDVPSDNDLPVAERCGADYCEYLVRLRFAPPASPDESNADTGDFTMQSAGGWYVPPEDLDDGVDLLIVDRPADALDMPASWMQDAAASHTVVTQLVDTTVTLSADSRPVGGDDITATITAQQFPDADILAAYPYDGIWLEVELTLSWPSFLTRVGDPVGCTTWRATDQTCILRFYDSPPGEAREIELTFSVPPDVPYTGGSGDISVSASRVDVMAGDDGDYSFDEAPTSTVVPSHAAFEVYRPILQTSVTLDSSTGWPGGDDVIATFSVDRPPSSSDTDLGTGTAEVRVTWPDFLTLVGPPSSSCEDFAADPGGSSGVCTVAVAEIGLPGAEPEFEMVFAMPPEGAVSPQAGDITIEGVSLTVPNDEGGETVYDGRFILPSSADFSIDSGAYAVDVVLDRSVSTVGGTRLYGEVHVRFDHAVPGERDAEAIGIAIGWPDFLEVVDPPGIVGCDEWDGDICFLTQLRDVGDEQVVQVWFDMPAVTGGVGEITATGARLCDGPPTDCTEMPAQWIGSDAEPFAVVDPRIDIDVTVDREIGWTGGKPITATVTVTHAARVGVAPTGAVAETLPGLTADLTLVWPGFLTPITVSGCDPIVAGGGCRIAGLDAVGSSRTLSLQMAMPAVEDARTLPPGTSIYPATGEIRVRGLAFTYLAAPPMPLPTSDPSPTPTPSVTASPTPSPSPSPTLPECSKLVIIPDCVPVIDTEPELLEPVIAPLRPENIGSDSATVTVLQPKVTVVPGVARPGEVVTVHLENMPPGAAVTTAWGLTGSVAEAVDLPDNVTVSISRTLIIRRAALGPRELVVASVDGLFGDIHPAIPLLVVPRSTVADELVGRGG